MESDGEKDHQWCEEVLQEYFEFSERKVQVLRQSNGWGDRPAWSHDAVAKWTKMKTMQFGDMEDTEEEEEDPELGLLAAISPDRAVKDLGLIHNFEVTVDYPEITAGVSGLARWKLEGLPAKQWATIQEYEKIWDELRVILNDSQIHHLGNQFRERCSNGFVSQTDARHICIEFVTMRYDNASSGGCEVEISDATFSRALEMVLQHTPNKDCKVPFDMLCILAEVLRCCWCLDSGENAGWPTREVKMLRGTFQGYDRLGNGLQANQMFELIKDIGIKPDLEEQHKVVQFIREGDLDGNGTLDFQEFLMILRRFADDAQHTLNRKDRDAMKVCREVGIEDLFINQLKINLRKLDKDGTLEYDFAAVKKVLGDLGCGYTKPEYKELNELLKKTTSNRMNAGVTAGGRLVKTAPSILMVVAEMFKTDLGETRQKVRAWMDKRVEEWSSKESELRAELTAACARVIHKGQKSWFARRLAQEERRVDLNTKQ